MPNTGKLVISDGWDSCHHLARSRVAGGPTRASPGDDA